MERLGSRERKLIALLLLVLVVALAYLAVIVPVLNGFDQRREQRALSTLRYQRNERLIASVPRLRRVLEAQEPERRKFVLAARDAAEAQDYLQERLRTFLSEAGSDLTAAEPVETAAGAAAISGSARLTYPQALDVIKRVQNDQPYLLIDGLTIVANQALVTGRLDTLDVKIDISIPFAPATQR